MEKRVLMDVSSWWVNENCKLWTTYCFFFLIFAFFAPKSTHLLQHVVDDLIVHNRVLLVGLVGLHKVTHPPCLNFYWFIKLKFTQTVVHNSPFARFPMNDKYWLIVHRVSASTSASSMNFWINGTRPMKPLVLPEFSFDFFKFFFRNFPPFTISSTVISTVSKFGSCPFVGARNWLLHVSGECCEVSNVGRN